MAEPDDDKPAESTVTIARNPDVALIVGPEKKKLLVSSAVLANASKYFTNLFGPNFREGQDIGKDTIKEISMPEDDAEALEILCNILHLQNSKVPRDLAPALVLRVAIAADKFECIESSKYMVDIWLGEDGKTTIEEQGCLMAASYILDRPKDFMDCTYTLIVDYEESYMSLANAELKMDEQAMWRVICRSH
jgi:hypothetical protein